MPRKIIIFRHGETDHNKNRIIQGWADVPLNERGKSQAKKLAQRLKNFKVDAFYTSDLKRSLQTAREVEKLLGKKPKKSKYIRERSFGKFENKKWDEIGEEFKDKLFGGPNSDDKDWKEHEGETRNEVRSRVKDFITSLFKNHKDETVLISTHGGTKRYLLVYLGVINPDYYESIGNTSISIVEKDKNGEFKLSLFNDTTHLAELC